MEARAEGPFSDATSSSEWGGKEEQHIALCPEVFSNVTFSFVSPRSRVLSFSCVMPQPLPPMSILVYYIIVKGKSQWEISASPSSFFYDVYMSLFFPEFRPNLEYTIIRKKQSLLLSFYVLCSSLCWLSFTGLQTFIFFAARSCKTHSRTFLGDAWK